MRLRMLLAAALFAGSTVATVASAQPMLVAVHTDDAIHFVSQDALDEVARVGRQAAIMPVPQARLWPAVHEYLLEPDEDWRQPGVADYVRARERSVSECTESGYFCAGLVRTYRSSLDSWRWQVGDPIEGRSRRVLGVSFTMTIT